MPSLRLLTGGESHGPAITAILEGIPAGLRLDREAMAVDMARRQRGYGRGGRMKIEKDEAEILSGVRGGLTLGSPVTFVIRNRDFGAWVEVMDPWTDPEAGREVTRPRPGHADLAGALKLGTHDARDVLERASARSTAARVAAGAVARALLRCCGIEVGSQVVRIGPEPAPSWLGRPPAEIAAGFPASEASEVRCADAPASAAMVAAIDAARQAGDSLGGVLEVAALGVPPGLGSFMEVDRRLDGRLAAAVMSIQAIKGVEIGLGFASASMRGSDVHDPIHYAPGVGAAGFVRPTNRAGGIEGGVSNGEPILVRAAMKPIPTLARPLASVDLRTKQSFDAARERTDSVAVPAAAVVAEAAVMLVLADALLEKTGGDTLEEVLRNLQAYRDALRGY